MKKNYSDRIPSEKGTAFKFSFIMAVYNVEKYIDEAIESITNQTFGFDGVQIILVDDGSPDGSGDICDRYKEKYPDNIVVIHKENGGVSSARNAGLAVAEGKYICCLDPDDYLTETTLADVYTFFEQHYNETDVVAIKLTFFGDKTGPHYLNDKFKNGSRVINLKKEMKFFQLSCSSAFIKHDRAKLMHFDESLTVAEDAQQMLRILIDKPFLGVVDSCDYMYRRHQSSAISSGLKKHWYNDYIYSFVIPSLDYAEQKYGYIPRFVQNAIMSNLQWRLSEKTVPTILDDEELERYRSGIFAVISRIDDDIIMSQKHAPFDNLVYLISRKRTEENYVTRSATEIYYGYDSRTDARFSRGSFLLSFLNIDKEYVSISVKRTILNVFADIGKIFLKVGEKRIDADSVKMKNHGMLLGEATSYSALIEFRIPRELLSDDNTVKFFIECDGIEIQCTNIFSTRFFPISTSYENAYYYKDGLVFTIEKPTLRIKKTDARGARKYERKLLCELWASNKRRAVLARVINALTMKFIRKPVWIITDRLNKAGDNGEAFFLHLKESHFKKAKYYFAITDCADYKRMKREHKNIILYGSKKYKFLFLLADHIISSQGEDFLTNPFDKYSEPYKDIIRDKKFVFLQHGVIKDDLSGWLNKYNKNIYGFITSATAERDSIINGDYEYESDKVWLTGLPRFDRLYNNEKKKITVMPTWRKYLVSTIDKNTGVWEQSDSFKSSEYFKFYNKLINDEKLLLAAKKHGYTLCFMPHPNAITNIDTFDKKEDVEFYSINSSYRDVYAESSLILTDYSSAVFDFAYLRKPIIYTHFDKDTFFSGEHVYVKGYYEYERDGFGEVVYDYDSTVELLISYMEGGCKLKDEYRARIDSFFAYADKNNSERILEHILGKK